MNRIVLAVAAVLTLAGGASAQHCRGVRVQSAAPVAAPVYYPPAFQPLQSTYVGLPVAVYVVPGNPTVALNVYPGQFTLVQTPPPVNLTVNVNGQKVEAKVEEKK